MQRDDWTVTSSSARPAGRPDRCFYCDSPVGGTHAEDCVVRSRTVLVDVTFRMVMDFPESWSTEMIEFRLNESGYCFSNAVDRLSEMIKDEDDPDGFNCLCSIGSARYVGEATAEDEESQGVRVADCES